MKVKDKERKLVANALKATTEHVQPTSCVKSDASQHSCP